LSILTSIQYRRVSEAGNADIVTGGSDFSSLITVIDVFEWYLCCVLCGVVPYHPAVQFASGGGGGGIPLGRPSMWR
jgi:hypothetical protein